ncbi:hypothetical protein ACP70R_033410 [Stipagrostis hirtigluma subsp. patula]
MITNVESKNYFSGDIDMADSSVDLNVNLFTYYEENKSSRLFTDKFTMASTNGSVDYDKEMLKRTMLVHEATFRKQIYELHRLYRTQKNLMAQFQTEVFSSYPRYVDTVQTMSSDSSQAPSGDVKGAWQAGLKVSGHDLKQASTYLMNGSGTNCSSNGTPLKHNGIRLSKKMLDLELPAQMYADDDDLVEIMDEKPSDCLPWANGSVRSGNVKLNLGSSEGSSYVDKSWAIDIQPRHDSVMHILNKPVKESSNMGTDFLGVGISTAQNQHYLSGGMNINVLSLEGNIKVKCTGKLSGGNEEIRHNDSFRHKNDEPNTSVARLKCKQNTTDSSMGHYMYGPSFNHLILARPGFKKTLNSPWQSKDTSYMANFPCDAIGTDISKNVLSNGISMDSAPSTSHHHSLKIPGEPQHRNDPPVQDFLQDINLNEAPQVTTHDAAATCDQGSGSSVVETSWLKKKPVELMKPQVPSNYANGSHSQILVGSSSYTEVRTTTINFGFPTSAAMEKHSWRPSSPQSGTNIAPPVEHEAGIEILSQNTIADTNKRFLIDLNEALSFMDDPEMDVHELEGGSAPHEPECDIAPHEPDDSLSDSLAITVAESLVAMHNDLFQAGSPKLDTLHWFADLATLNEIATSNNDSDDDFEALTLKLQETKSCEYHSTPRTAQEDDNREDHCSAASLILTRRRRGQARGRCRKKDFQKDVLPGLASLSKQEVSEDLYAFGWSMPATLAKRGGGRNGQQPRGRRRARSAVGTVEEEARVSPPPVSPPLVPADLGADALGITRWGRTIRRCRRPRCPPAKIFS